ncbi:MULTISPECIES: ABC transporter substrate-binding protein [Rhodomicrobium]|uniref:ABC transporter substrate-binding protein n=1 Tax=Rhodomicrobium TaxID=1068 RepID=UPI000B4A5C0B|nr:MULTISPECIES: ABC transporter substrate-binding protein [Rhodomicrobium]
MRFCVAGALLMLLAGLAAAPSWAEESKGFVDIGCMYPMTGRGALYGRDSIAALEMAVDEVNAAGGAAGYQFRIFRADSQSKPAFAVSIARRFITERKVHFLCGVVSSSVGLAVSEVAREHKKIFIGTDHASSRLTIENAHPYYFRVSNNVYQAMAAGALWLAEAQKKRGWKTIAFIGPDYEYGRGAWADLRSKLDEAGVQYEVIGDLWPKLYEPDFALYIAELKRLKPDVIVNAHWGGDFVAFVRQAKSLGLFDMPSIFANFDSGGNYEVMSVLEDDMPLGLVLSARHHNNWPDTERNRRFVDSFHQRTGHYPSYAAEGAYAGILAIKQAVAMVGNPDDTEALIVALEGMELELPEDPDGFRSHIDPATHQIVQMQAIGTVVRDDRFPPAKTMLGNFEVYDADRLLPSQEEIVRRRGEVGRSSSLQSPPVR